MDTNVPISLAHIKFTPHGNTNGEFKWVVSDSEGYATNPFSDTTDVLVMYTGFENVSVTLLPYEVKVVQLLPTVQEVGEVVVTAQFIPVEIQNSIYKTETIDDKRIEEKGANNLREALNNELNFKTNNGHVNETAINLNGLSGNHIKFMIDGVPVEGRLNGNIDLSQINMNDVEKIEIIEGPTSVAYGSNALGGVINIITKKQQAKKVNVNLKGYYESIGQYNFSGKVGWKIKRNLIKISGGRNFFQGYSQVDTSRLMDWKPREQYFGSLLFSRRINHFTLSYVFDGFTEKMTSRGAPKPPYYENAFDTYYTTDRLTNKLLFRGRITQKNYLDLTLSQSYYRRTRNIYYKDLVTLEQTLTPGSSDQDTTTFNNYMFRGVFSTDSDSSRWNYMVGAEVKYDLISSQRVSNYTQRIGDYAIFGNVRYSPIEALTIQPALRYAYNSKYKAPLVPSLNILWKLGKNTKLRASYARGFRAPDLKELYLEFHYNSTINLWGNEQLKSENSDHLNLSVDFKRKIKDHVITLSPKVYYSKINNLIDLVQTSPVDWTYTNVDYLITQGASMKLGYMYQNFEMRFAYTYYGNYNSQFNNADVPNKFFYSNDCAAGTSYLFEKLALKLVLNYKYTGTLRNYYLDDNQEVNESFIGNYHTFDFSVIKRFWKDRISITAGVKNLFDVRQVNMTGEIFGVSNANGATTLNVLWGRSYFASLNFNF